MHRYSKPKLLNNTGHNVLGSSVFRDLNYVGYTIFSVVKNG